ncbi:glycosyltransferase family 9 protein [Fusobacterium sp. SB021]|uniref:glycosyltransferase family 9 protein n=1 Tax=Fusobacterium sp. SB021 TaxID=2744227 RepID=UPI003CF13EFE
MLRAFLIRLIGNKKKKEFDIKKIHRILIPGGRVGDIIVKTPMLRVLSKLNNDVKIDISVEKGCESLVKYHPNINKILVSEKKPSKIKIIKMLMGIISALKIRKKYDLCFDFTRNPRFFHLLTMRVLGARYLVGCYRTEKFGIKKDELTLFDKYIDMSNQDHAVDINMNALKDFGVDISNRNYELYLGNLEEKYKNFFDKERINIIYNFLGSTPKRSLSEEDFNYFLKEIPKLDTKIVLYVLTIPSKYEEVKKLIEKLNKENIKILPKTESILEAAAILKYSDMLFSVDTGIVHVASVYNIPIVAIYTEDKSTLTIFAPKSKEHSIIVGKKEDFLREFDKNTVKNEILKMAKKVEKMKNEEESNI